jgi:hypothetical protein
VRQEPSLTGPVVWSAQQGTGMSVVRIIRDGEGRRWYSVRIDVAGRSAVRGWVLSGVVAEITPCPETAG